MDDDQLRALTPTQRIVWHLRQAAQLLEEHAQDRPAAPADAEDAQEPARPYRHVCQQCGVPLSAEGLCTDCLEAS